MTRDFGHYKKVEDQSYAEAMAESSRILDKIPSDVLFNILCKFADMNPGTSMKEYRESLTDQEVSVMTTAALPTIGTVLHLRVKKVTGE